MGTLARLVIIGAAAVAMVPVAAADTVQVLADGRVRGMFEARGEPYETDGPSVAVYLEKRDTKTADGRVITGFEFTGWPEGGGVRVQVYLLVPGPGAANAYLPDGKRESLVRRYFSSVLLATGDEVALDKMDELGVEPMKVRLR